VFEVEGAQRAASNRLIISAAVIAFPVKARGDQRSVKQAATGACVVRVM
jgi:hypothetical protein